MERPAATQSEIFDILLDCKMFGQLRSDELRGAAAYFSLHDYAKGETVFNEGDKGSFMCVIHQGSISVVKTDRNDEAVVMGVEGPGRVFGEMAVLDGEPRSATCLARSDCRMLVLEKTALDAMIEEKPRLGAKVLRAIAISLSRRMRLSAGRLVDQLEHG